MVVDQVVAKLASDPQSPILSNLPVASSSQAFVPSIYSHSKSCNSPYVARAPVPIRNVETPPPSQSERANKRKELFLMYDPTPKKGLYTNTKQNFCTIN